MGLVVKPIKKRIKSDTKTMSLPKVFIDKANDFAAIKIAKGIEHKSYEKDGFVFCEDKVRSNY